MTCITFFCRVRAKLIYRRSTSSAFYFKRERRRLVLE
jgi:hypothetical protein